MTGPWNVRLRGGRTKVRKGHPPRLELLEDRMLLATFTVTDTSDSASDTGSLRYAITQSNLTGPGPNTIDFNIPGTGVQTIAPALGAADDHRAGDDRWHHAARLQRHAVDRAGREQCRVGERTRPERRRLHGPGWSSTISAAMGSFWAASGDVVTGCFVGVDATGTVAAGNGGHGIECTADSMTIGGTTAGAGNVISGNGDGGIEFRGSGTGDVVQGNFIGTDVTGTKALANKGDGIWVYDPDGVLIGGTTPGRPQHHLGQLRRRSRHRHGVGSRRGQLHRDRRHRHGRRAQRTVTESSSTGVSGSARAARRSAGPRRAGNVISGNGSAPASTSRPTPHVIEGTSSAPTRPAPLPCPTREWDMHRCRSGKVGYDNTIGGTVAAARNVISGNRRRRRWRRRPGQCRVGQRDRGQLHRHRRHRDARHWPIRRRRRRPRLHGRPATRSAARLRAPATSSRATPAMASTVFGVPDVLIEGNFIGTDATGTNALPNGGDGVMRGQWWRSMRRSAGPRPPRETSSRATPSMASPSRQWRCHHGHGRRQLHRDRRHRRKAHWAMETAASRLNESSNTIGGTAAGAGNLISANGTTQEPGSGRYRDGITIFSNYGATDNLIQGNLIGTDVTGTPRPGQRRRRRGPHVGLPE